MLRCLGFVGVVISFFMIPTPTEAKLYQPKRAEYQYQYDGGTDLIMRARTFLGTNPTGRHSLWCGAFMAMVAPSAARHIRNPNLARNWASLPHTYPHVGAIAVFARGRGGHVGLITEIRGNYLIVISGNHGHRVAIGKYPRSRVIAYVSGYV